jgi:hypothetical protein
MTLTALESLASWQRISVAEAARQVLALDEDARMQLQRDYALVHSTCTVAPHHVASSSN